MSNILFYEVFEEEQRSIKKYLPFNLEAQFTKNTFQEADLRPNGTVVVCIRTQSIIPEEHRASIKGVFTRSQGFDHLTEFIQTTNNKIPCGHLKSYCSTAVAEQAILAMLSLMRCWKKQIQQFEYFNRDGITGEQVYNKKALIVGTGVIGSEIVRLVKGLGMAVKGVDPLRPLSEVEYVSLEEGLLWADVIFCAADLNETSEGLINYTRMANLENRPYVINISRGEITPIGDMKRLLDAQKIKGLAMDVFPDEKDVAALLRQGSISGKANVQDLLALKNRDNVIFTPHNAFNAVESLEEKSKQTVEAIEYFLKNGNFPHPVKI